MFDIDECQPYSQDGWVNKGIVSHLVKMRNEMRSRGLILKMYQYREFMGFPPRGVNLRYRPPSNHEFREMETYLQRETDLRGDVPK